MHLDGQDAAALAGLAPAALDIEAEPSRAIAAHLGVLCVGKQAANVPEYTGIGGRVGARGAPDGRLVNADDLIDPLHALNLLALAGAAAGTVERCGQRFIQDLIDKGGLAGAGHTRDADHLAQREIHRDALQVILMCFDDAQEFPIAGAPHFGYLDIFTAREVRTGNAALGFADIRHTAGGNDLTAVDTGTGADVHDIIRLPHCILVMLHHDQSVAKVAQTLHRGDQLIIVTLVQTDARLVQHIQHTGQGAADLGCQTDALALTAGQRGCTAGERQIAKAHTFQKTKPLLHLFKDRRTDHLIAGADLGRADKLQLLVDAFLAEVGDIDAAHRDSKAGRLQAAAVTGRTNLAGHDEGDFFLDPFAACLAEAALKVGDDALKLVVVGAGAEHALALHLDALLTGAVQQGMQGLLAEILDGGVERKAIPLAQCVVGHLGDRALGIIPAAGLDGALTDGLAFVGNDAGGVHLHKGAEAGAFLAGTEGVVEAEHPGGQLLDRDTMLRAGIALAEHHRLAADDINNDQPVGLRQRGLNGIRQTAANRIIDNKAVYHDFDRVLDVLLEVDFLAQVIHIAVDPHAGKAGAAGRIQFLSLRAFAGTHDRCQHLKAGALRQLQHLVHHLIHRLLRDLASADWAMRHTDAGIHQAQVVVDLGHRAHSRARVVACGLLVDRDSRGKAGDLIHVRLFHLPQKLAGVAGKALHIAALAIRKDRVKGKT